MKVLSEIVRHVDSDVAKVDSDFDNDEVDSDLHSDSNAEYAVNGEVNK